MFLYPSGRIGDWLLLSSSLFEATPMNLALHPEHKATDEACERKPGPPRSKAQVLRLPKQGSD
jgi:hypothetical protein